MGHRTERVKRALYVGRVARRGGLLGVLGKLVDEVPPVPFGEIERVIAEELPADVFVQVDPEPLATASIAQIHQALLASGRDVIVKVRRPAIEEQVELDLALLRSTANLLEARSERAQLLQ